MPKSELSLAAGEYAPVADRIVLFYERFPGGRIVTTLVSRTEREVVFRASVYRTPDDKAPAATGWAAEREGDGDVNAVACLENTETSAIGRALANLGFTASAKRPSAEEMAKASRERARLAGESATPAPARPPRPRPLRVSEPPVGGAAAPRPAGARSALLADVEGLLAEAERAGFGDERALRLRARLASGRTTPVGLERVERGLRRWLAGRREGASGEPAPRARRGP